MSFEADIIDTGAEGRPESDRLAGLPHPRETERLIGHEAAEAELRASFLGGRMPHAWLLAGPPRIGKATLAYRFARFVLAHGGRGDAAEAAGRGLDLPPDHPVFRRVAAQSHGDLLVLRRPWDARAKRLKAALTVEEMRRLQPFFGMSASEGGWRVCIIDSADEMNTSAANALLKTLEEPPACSLLLLVCHAPHRLLPTIRSRARLLRLRPLAEDAVLEVLAGQRPDLAPEAARALARLAEGSPGRALALAGAGGFDLYRDLVGLLADLPALEPLKAHQLAERVGGERFELFAELLDLWLLRLVRSAARGREMAEVAAGEGRVMALLRGPADLDRWVELWEKVSRLVAEAGALHLDRRAVVLTLFAHLQATARGAAPG